MARGGPEVARGCDFQDSRVSWGQEALEKTLYGAPASLGIPGLRPETGSQLT